MILVIRNPRKQKVKTLKSRTCVFVQAKGIMTQLKVTVICVHKLTARLEIQHVRKTPMNYKLMGTKVKVIR